MTKKEAKEIADVLMTYSKLLMESRKLMLESGTKNEWIDSMIKWITQSLTELKI